VARSVVRLAGARRLPDRRKVGAVAHALPFLRRWLPVRLWDRVLSRQTGLHLVQPSPRRLAPTGVSALRPRSRARAVRSACTATWSTDCSG
jgi:hypothetical protein